LELDDQHEKKKHADTVASWESLAALMKQILNVFECSQLNKGTCEIADCLAELTEKGDGTTIFGGGDSMFAEDKAGLAEEVAHICNGGGANLELLGGNVLPGEATLDGAAKPVEYENHENHVNHESHDNHENHEHKHDERHDHEHNQNYQKYRGDANHQNHQQHEHKHTERHRHEYDHKGKTNHDEHDIQESEERMARLRAKLLREPVHAGKAGQETWTHNGKEYTDYQKYMRALGMLGPDYYCAELDDESTEGGDQHGSDYDEHVDDAGHDECSDKSYQQWLDYHQYMHYQHQLTTGST